MKRVTATFTFTCDPSRYWSVFLDRRYLEAVYLEALGYRSLEVLELGDASRKLRLVPKLSLPGPIEKLMGDSFAYEEHGTLDREKNLWTWRMVPPSNAKPKKELVATRGTSRVEAIEGGKVRRTDEVFIESGIFGLGGLIESSAEKECHAAWPKETGCLRTWLEKPAG